MSTATLSRLKTFDRPPVPVRRFTVEEYQRLTQNGVLTENSRVELLEGWLVPKMIHNPAHALAIENGQDVLPPLLPPDWRLRIQLPISTGESEPEPDFAIVRRMRLRRKLTHPRPQDVAVVIEVSDTTLAEDRTFKLRIYARARIPAYWIINLIARRIEVYSNPTGPAEAPTYRTRQTYGLRKSVPLIIAGNEVSQVPVRDLLP